MNKSLIQEKIIGYLAQNGKQVQADSQLLGSGLMDSMELINLVAFMEDELGLEIEQEDLVIANFESVRKILKLFETREQA